MYLIYVLFWGGLPVLPLRPVFMFCFLHICRSKMPLKAGPRDSFFSPGARCGAARRSAKGTRGGDQAPTAPEVFRRVTAADSRYQGVRSVRPGRELINACRSASTLARPDTCSSAAIQKIRAGELTNVCRRSWWWAEGPRAVSRRCNHYIS